MGGPGSGNFYHWRRGAKKTTTDNCLSLDANRWSREGVLKAGARLAGRWSWTYPGGKGFSVNYVVDMLDTASPSLYLDYTWVWPTRPDEPQAATYRVDLAATSPRLGGLR